MYLVKTRNWHCRKWVKFFLDFSHMWGAERADSYDDGDAKYILKTRSMAVAMFTWIYYMLFSHFSGGWTYVHNGEKFLLDSEPVGV
jgi:hypothetical protein